MTAQSRRLSGARRLATVLVAAVTLFAGITLAARADSEQKRPRVIFVTFPCTEPNFACSPFLQALRRTGVSGKIVAPDVREDQVATLSLLARQGYDLIIVDFNWIETLGRVAPRFPNARFAIIDIPLAWIDGRPPNVQGIVIRTHEASYLAGWLATRLEQRRVGKDVIGAVGGVKGLPQVEDFIIGFRAGARRASPKVTVLTGYSNDFADATKCEAIARSQIARGAGAVFNVAGACGLGALRAAKRGEVWGIGVDRDQSFLGPHILTSVVKRHDIVMLTLLRQVRDGRIRTGATTQPALRKNGADLGRISPKVPAALRAELGRLRSRIVAGDIRVPGARYG
jgi:basic membrane protein A and related proteins